MFLTRTSEPRIAKLREAGTYDRQRGFTLAGVLVILTILAVVLAYTVPQMWSDVMRRERDIQTIWTMKQYARAIAEFQRRRQALPVSLEQLEEQNRPRVLRKLYPDPLTGQMDWVLIPVGSVTPGQTAPGLPPAQQQTPNWGSPSPQNPNWGRTPQPGSDRPGGTQGNTSADDDESSPSGSGRQVGPFIGVRPPITGRAYLSLNGSDRYENWSYTVLDLQNEQAQANRPPGAGMPQSVPQPTPVRP